MAMCSYCHNDECESLGIMGERIVGCNNCLVRVKSLDLLKNYDPLRPLVDIGCPVCGRINPEFVYFHRLRGWYTEVAGCSRCIREVNATEWRENDAIT